jgi:tetratricopeptide (TPR) repeat protein
MGIMRTWNWLVRGLCVVALTGLPYTRIPAQEPIDALKDARAALQACLRYVEGPEEQRGTKDDAKAAFERAEQAFRAAIAGAPRNADAHAGLGETLSRCGIPHAGMTTIMTVVEASTRALQTALAIDPQHWQARFILAMNSFNLPAFLNQMPAAVRELETLVQQQNGKSGPAHFALTYLYLGQAYEKTGRANDARVAYAAGARLFPENEELLRRAHAAGVPIDSGTTLSVAPAGDMPTVHALEPLRVDGAQHQLEAARSGTSLRRIDVYTMPGGTGEMLQTLQTQPGVTRAGDGADLYVRGGDPEETPIFVNGGRLAFPGRWESLNGSSMGVLDASVLSRAYFSAGGFSAKYGNALSGVVDVETRGRPMESSWRIGANTVSAGASLYRPLGARSGAWGTVMLTDVTLVTRMQGTEDTYPDVPRSYQMIGGGSFEPTPTLEVKVVGLAAGDESSRIVDTGGFSGPFHSAGRTQHGAVSGRWLRPDDRVGLIATVSASRRDGGFTFGLLERDRVDEAYGVRMEADVIAASGMRVRSGIELTHFGAVTSGRMPLTRDLNPGSPSLVLDGVTESTTHMGGYVEVEHALSRALVGVAGVRADRLPGQDDLSLDPRIALAYTTGPWTLRGGAGGFSQGSWRRTYRLPDAGVPSGAPTRARHAVVGAERSGEPSVRVEAYAKLYDRYAAGGGGGPDIDEGRTVGIDAIVRWQRQARLNGWITWSMMDAALTLADGDVAPARFDVTHSLTGVARLAVTDAWELGTTVRYATGKPYTPVLGATPSDRDGWPAAPVFGDTHGARLPHYARIDGRITRYQKIAGKTGVFYLEMLDLNGRRNIVGYQYDATFETRKPVESFFARRAFVLGAELGF